MNISKEALELIERIHKCSKIIIYGAKEKGRNMLIACLNLGRAVNIEVAITELKEPIYLETKIGEIEVKEISDIDVDENAIVFVCMQDMSYEDATNVLKKKGINMQQVFFPGETLILELKKYAIYAQLRLANIDLDLLKGFSPDDIGSLFFLWTSENEANCRSINKRMWEIANAETAEYVMGHMPKTFFFKNRAEYLDYISATYLQGDGVKLEFGVAGEASIWKFGKRAKGMVYGFDSFDGLAEDFTSSIRKGTFRQQKLPKVPENVELIKGFFSDSLPSFLSREEIVDKRIDFIHMDCDLYSSTRDVLNMLTTKITAGTIIAFDEYFNYPGWKNEEFKAFQEWVKGNCVEYEYVTYVDNDRQVAVRIVNNPRAR